MRPVIEVCCYNVATAMAAKAAGAHRIELCGGKELDGTTPSRQVLAQVLEAVEGDSLQVHVMIRPAPCGAMVDVGPRAFSMAPEDIASAEQFVVEVLGQYQIAPCSNRVHGVVFGALKQLREHDGGSGWIVDMDALQAVAAAAHRVGITDVTFHRAFDFIDFTLTPQAEVLRGLQNVGCVRILSCGSCDAARSKAIHNIQELCSLAMIAEKHRVSVMPAGGVTARVVRYFLDIQRDRHSDVGGQITEYHGSFLEDGEDVPSTTTIAEALNCETSFC